MLYLIYIISYLNNFRDIFQMCFPIVATSCSPYDNLRSRVNGSGLKIISFGELSQTLLICFSEQFKYALVTYEDYSCNPKIATIPEIIIVLRCLATEVLCSTECFMLCSFPWTTTSAFHTSLSVQSYFIFNANRPFEILASRRMSSGHTSSTVFLLIGPSRFINFELWISENPGSLECINSIKSVLHGIIYLLLPKEPLN